MLKSLLKRGQQAAAGNEATANCHDNRIDSLGITNFRGIDQLEISRLGDVSLVAGKNGVGKTTILEALRVYAARGSAKTLEEVLDDREELTTFQDSDGDPLNAPAVDRLFHRSGRTIEIGPTDGASTLKIAEVHSLNDVPERLRDFFRGEDMRYLSITLRNEQVFLPWSGSSVNRSGVFRDTPWSGDTSTNEIRCESVGATPPDGRVVARLWDRVVLTDDEVLPLDALRLVFGDNVERAAVVGDGAYRARRRIVVKLADRTSVVPLRSLGEGAVRMFVVALALANCRNGILLVDEAENGIHYSLQSKFWKMVLHTAGAHNTQVVATTHSKDCINGFAAAALECPDVSGNLIRVDQNDGLHRAVDYSEEELETAAEQNIEVR